MLQSVSHTHKYVRTNTHKECVFELKPCNGLFCSAPSHLINWLVSTVFLSCSPVCGCVYVCVGVCVSMCVCKRACVAMHACESAHVCVFLQSFPVSSLYWWYSLWALWQPSLYSVYLCVRVCACAGRLWGIFLPCAGLWLADASGHFLVSSYPEGVLL